MSDPAQILSPLTKPHATDETVKSAVLTLTDQAQANAASIGDYLWDTYNAIFDAAGRTPPQRQGKLIDLLIQLRQVTTTGADGQPLQHEGGVVWKDLPTFGWVARDCWNFDALDPSATTADQTKWANWTALLAQLTARAKTDNPNDPFDFSLFALWAMRTAFEETHAESVDAGHAVRQAAFWVTYGGPRLRKLCAEGRELEGNMGVSRGKYEGKGWRGFNDERWGAWKDGFKAAKERGWEDGGALEVMERL